MLTGVGSRIGGSVSDDWISFYDLYRNKVCFSCRVEEFYRLLRVNLYHIVINTGLLRANLQKVRQTSLIIKVKEILLAFVSIPNSIKRGRYY
jgi:hypothetical protein